MISITVYDITSGKILRKAMLSPEMVEANLSEGEGWIDGFYDPMLFVVEDGVAKKIDNEQLEAAQTDTAWRTLRMVRNSYLAASDWTQVPDAPVDRAAWATYRQALRDLPYNTTDPRNPAWPTPPA